MNKSNHNIINTYTNKITGLTVYECLINGDDVYYIDDSCNDDQIITIDESDLI